MYMFIYVSGVALIERHMYIDTVALRKSSNMHLCIYESRAFRKNKEHKKQNSKSA